MWPWRKPAKKERPWYRPVARVRWAAVSWTMLPSTSSAWKSHRLPNWPAQSLYRGCLPCCRTPRAPCCRSSNLSRARKSEWALSPSYCRAAPGLSPRERGSTAISWSRSPVVVRPRNPPGRPNSLIRWQLCQPTKLPTGRLKQPDLPGWSRAFAKREPHRGDTYSNQAAVGLFRLPNCQPAKPCPIQPRHPAGSDP
jgi:hypothetical protein